MKSTAQIETLIKLMIQLQEILKDFAELSKKKPNDQVNKFKLRLVNQVLETANEIIDEKNKPFADFTVFDENDLPSNSDVVLILTQYSACLQKFRKENIAMDDAHDRYWIINGKRSKIPYVGR
ncbi:MAG: hypothetical protein IH588_19475 [Anaerolineales bacterium]|nr:hypothetical protein [Anaerolineales bacterium]